MENIEYNAASGKTPPDQDRFYLGVLSERLRRQDRRSKAANRRADEAVALLRKLWPHIEYLCDEGPRNEPWRSVELENTLASVRRLLGK